jgi:hypothetical protein
LAPLPPADLVRRRPVFENLRANTVLHRFFTAAFPPIHFDRSDSGRFNDPAGKYGVLYAARSLRGAFAETFLREPGRTLLAPDFIAKKGYVRLVATRPLRLIRFAGPGLARIGATAEVAHSGPPYDIPQAWSAELHTHSANADGIAYHARHDDEALCFAIFDRASTAIREQDRDLDVDSDWFWEVAEVYGVGLAP